MRTATTSNPNAKVFSPRFGNFTVFFAKVAGLNLEGLTKRGIGSDYSDTGKRLHLLLNTLDG
jgi:hypothetical protein